MKWPRRLAAWYSSAGIVRRHVGGHRQCPWLLDWYRRPDCLSLTLFTTKGQVEPPFPQKKLIVFSATQKKAPATLRAVVRAGGGGGACQVVLKGLYKSALGNCLGRNGQHQGKSAMIAGCIGSRRGKVIKDDPTRRGVTAELQPLSCGDAVCDFATKCLCESMEPLIIR